MEAEWKPSDSENDVRTVLEAQKALLAIIEEGFMQDGIIPNSHQRKFVLLDKIEEVLKGGPDVTKK